MRPTRQVKTGLLCKFEHGSLLLLWRRGLFLPIYQFPDVYNQHICLSDGEGEE